MARQKSFSYMSPAGMDLGLASGLGPGLGDMVSQQLQTQTEEERKRRQQGLSSISSTFSSLAQQSQSPVMQALFGGLRGFG